MKKSNIYIILLFVAFAFQANAQQIPVLNQYVFNPYLYNPARAGESGFQNLSLTHRNQWTGMPDAPVTSILSFDMPVNDSNVGIGGYFFADETHIINNYGGMATYAYHVPFNEAKDHRLSIGLSAGILTQRFDFLKATVENQADLAILQETENSVNFDFAAGINYHFKGLNVGFAMPQILNTEMAYREPTNFENVKFGLDRHILITASYLARFGNNKSISVEPIVMARKVTGLPMQFDATVLLGYKDKVWLGGGYRTGNTFSSAAGMSGSVAVRVKERFQVAYTFEASGSTEARTDLGNSHEFSVAYRFGGKTNKDKEMMERLQNIEDRVGKLESDVKSVDEKVETNTAELGDKIDELSEKLEKGIVGADKLAAMQAQLDKHEKDIEALKGDNAKILGELAATRARLDQLSAGGLGSGATVYFEKMSSAYFGKDSAVLSATEKSKLDALVSGLSTSDKFTLFLSGNASSDGDASYNMALSVRRANAVKEYLRSKGISNGSIFILPYGEEVPQDGSNSTDPNNRRVDMFLTK